MFSRRIRLVTNKTCYKKLLSGVFYLRDFITSEETKQDRKVVREGIKTPPGKGVKLLQVLGT